MNFNAYILAADPAWIEASVLSYYAIVDRIVVSYDETSTSWTGTALDVDECLRRLRAIDVAGKLDYRPGAYARREFFDRPMESETYQRQTALEQASGGADWVLQLDTDEVMPDPRWLDQFKRVPTCFSAIDWPMRTIFRAVRPHVFAEICSFRRRQVSSYPGPVAVRPNTRLRHARQSDAQTYRFEIAPTDTDPAAGGRVVDAVIDPSAAIVHLSWDRTEADILRKLRAWGHKHDFDAERYVRRVWRRTPKWWMAMYRFHPLVPRWWPALRLVELPQLERFHLNGVVGGVI